MVGREGKCGVRVQPRVLKKVQRYDIEIWKTSTSHDLSIHVFQPQPLVFSGQRALSPNTSKFEIHVVSLVVVLAQGLVKENPDLVRSPWLRLTKFNKDILKQI